jgi:hypothetical protein
VRLGGRTLLRADEREDVSDDASDKEDLRVDLDAELGRRREEGGGRDDDGRGDRRDTAHLVDRRLRGV